MELIGFSMTVLSTVDLSLRTGNELMQRVKKMSKNRQRIAKLIVDRLVTIKRRLEAMNESPADFPESMQDHPKDVQKEFEDAQKELDRLFECVVSSSQPRAFWRADKWAKDLQALETRYDRLYDNILNLTGFKGLTAEVRKVGETMVAEFRNIDPRSASDKSEHFKPSFSVPKNPVGVSLRLDDPSSLEGRLKKLLLDKGTNVVGAVGAPTDSSSTAAAVGMSGMGKTYALRAIGHDQEVRQHFTGGIYWISLGKDATDAKVITSLAKAVDESNGLMLSSRIRDMDVTCAVSNAARWFASECCLFLCDDLWKTGSKSQENFYFYTLKSLVDEGQGSRMLFSTQDKGIAELAGRDYMINFSSRSIEEARRIICQYSGFDPDDVSLWDEGAQASFNFVLDRCAGLPLALSIAGRTVAGLAERLQTRTEAWNVQKKRLKNVAGRRLQLIKKSGDCHPGLFDPLMASIESADSRVSQLVSGGGASAEKMLRALCVLQKQEWAPCSMLGRLWDIEEKDELEAVMEELESLSLVYVEFRDVRGERVLGIKLHDLVHDFCVVQARQEEGVVFWHTKLLNAYASSTSECSEESGAENEIEEWWSERISDDFYIHRNLARHLVESKRVGELQKLLLDFRWTVRQLEVNGLLVLDDDFRRLTDNFRCSNVCREEGVKRVKALEMLAGAVRMSVMSWPPMQREELYLNGRDLAFQMQSRLCTLASRIEWIKCYLESLDRCVEKPWLKAVQQCHTGPGGRLVKIFNLKNYAERIAFVGQTGNIVVGRKDGKLMFANGTSGETTDGFEVHKDYVTSVAVSEDGKRIVSSSGDRTIRIWDVERRKCAGEPLRVHTERVNLVALSSDGRFVVFRSDDETLRIWDVKTGEIAGEPLRCHTFDWKNSVAISSDGRFVVSGSLDSTLRIWDVKTGECVGEPLRGHTDWVSSVAISRDGRFVVSGSLDNTLRIWDVERRKCVGEPLRGHTNWVNSVAISRDGRFVISGSDDETVRIWDVKTGKCVGKPLRGHTGRVSIVAISSDGRFVVSGSDDMTLRIWNMNTGECGGDPRRGHNDLVNSVAISRDGRFVVSGSDDMTLRIWDVKTGECVGEPLRGHTQRVSIVAIRSDGRFVVSASSDKTVRIWDIEKGSCASVVEDGRAADMNETELLNTAFGQGENDVESESLESGTSCPRVVCRSGFRRIYLEENGDGKNSEFLALGTFDSPVRCWELDVQQKTLCAGLQDGTVAIMRIMDGRC